MILKGTETFEEISREFFKYKWRILAAFGGSRSGKTYAFLQCLIIYALKEKNKSVTIWRKTRIVCKSTVMKDFIRILKSNKGLFDMFSYDKTHSLFTCKYTGSSIQFEGADDEDKVLGSQQDVSYFNEITGMQKSVYLQIQQRTNDFIIADYNPSKHFWFDKLEKSKKNKFIHSTYLGNSECPVNIITDLNAYKPIDKEFIGEENHNYLSLIKDPKKAIEFISSVSSNLNEFNDLFLSWNNTINGTANKYMYDVYCLGKKSERPEKIFNGWQEISLKDYLSIDKVEYNGLDIGTSSPSALVGVKTDERNFYFRLKAYTPSKTENGIINILDKAVSRGVLNKKDWIIVDSAKLAYVDLLNRNGYYGIPAVKGAGSLESGIEVLQSFNIFFVFDKNIESEYEDYSYALDRDGVPTDRPIQKNDHILDALRYCITFVVGFLNITINKRI